MIYLFNRYCRSTSRCIHYKPSLSSCNQCGQKDSVVHQRKKPHGWFASLINRATNGCCSFRTAVCLNKQRKGREKCSVVLFTGRARKSTINWHSSLWHRRLSITVWPDSTPLRGLSAEDCMQEESKGGKKHPPLSHFCHEKQMLKVR